MRIDNPNLKEGARRIISQNLGLRSGEDMLVLIDETTEKVGRILADAARHMGVRTTEIKIYQKDQPQFSCDGKLPLPLVRAIESAQVLTISLSDNYEGTGFRRRILDYSRQIKTKVALMPGITPEMISELANLDYSLLISLCNALHKPLLFGRVVVITTIDAERIPHELSFELGSWLQPPTMSSGILHPQSFDNIPSGEVYIAPIKGTANGEIIINGSITGYVFDEGDEIKLTFKNGVLVKMLPSEHPAVKFLHKAIANARGQGDIEPDFLCELGIGVAPNIKKLSGNTLQDEKAYHTAHIAIGLNEPFGGNVNAYHIHEDMIILRPTIKVDGKSLIESGVFQINDNDWCFSYRGLKNPPTNIMQELMVFLTGNEAEIGDDRRLHRIYFNGTDTRTSVQVGDDETSFLAAKVYKFINRDEETLITTLSKAIDLPIDVTYSLLHVMGDIYKLVDFSQNHETMN